jgi:thiol peroxidase
MSTVQHKGHEVHTRGTLPQPGEYLRNFRLTQIDLKDLHLEDLKGKKVVFNIFPSIDTATCAMSVRKFNAMAAALENTVVVCVSKDLPFAQKRFCGAEGIDKVICGSQYKDNSFSEAFGVDLLDGALAGLMSRAVVVAGTDGKVLYSEQVSDIGHEPNYEAALQAL